MTASFRKCWAVFGIFLQDGLTYRASMIIWIMTDVVTAVTMPLVWARASAASGGPIGGFSIGDFVLYYMCLLLMDNFITTHIMWDIAMEIKEGNFTVYLVRPMSYYQYMYFRNLAWRLLRVVFFIPFFIVLLWLYHGYLNGEHVYFSLAFVLSLVLGHLVSFATVMMMSMLALFTQEVFSIFELYYFPMIFLSGQLFPVAMLPHWAQVAAKLLPFYFTTGAPTEILIGRVTGPAIYQTLAIQASWVAIAFLLSKWLWAKGLKHYSGVGM
jgi:ABC-2 type transport system permease protein